MRGKRNLFCTIVLCFILFVWEIGRIDVMASEINDVSVKEEVVEEGNNTNGISEGDITYENKEPNDTEKTSTPINEVDEINKKMIKLCFDDTYGNGEFKVLGSDEWEPATGCIDLELIENESITVQIRANEGYFIVTEGTNEFVTEKEITMSWNEASDSYSVQFEQLMNASVTLNNTSGYMGNVFLATVNVNENYNIENVNCSWYYDENSVSTTNKSTQMGEQCTFNVISTMGGTVEIGAQIYRNGIYLGNATSSSYEIKGIDTNKLLNEFSVKECKVQDKSLNLLEQGTSKVIGDICFYVQVNNEYINSISHEISQVKLMYATSEQIMTINEDGIYEGTIDVNADSASEVIPQIKLVTKNNCEFVYTSKHCLKADKTKPTIEVQMIDDEKVFDDEWISNKMLCGQLRLMISVKDESEITECVVSDNSGVNYVIERVETGIYYVNISPNSAIYTIKVADAGENIEEKTFEVKADNVCPSKEIEVTYSSPGKLVSDLGSVEKYVIGDKEQSVYSDSHITVKLRISDENSTGECAGIKKVIVTVQKTTTDECKDVIYEFNEEDGVKGNSERTISFCVDKDIIEAEMDFQIKQIYIEDFVGNHSMVAIEGDENETCVDKVHYRVDNKHPVIEYKYTDKVANKEEEVIYFAEVITGTIEVSDLSLNKYEVSVDNVEGYDRAEIVKSDDNNEIKNIHSFSLNTDGKYQINTTVNPVLEYEIEKGMVSKHSVTMVVDTIEPVIGVKLSDESGTEITDYANQYYNKNINVQISIEEANVDTVSAIIINKTDGEVIYSENDFIKNNETGIYELEHIISTEGEYSINVVCSDKTGREITYDSDVFFIDKTAPEVTITYDNNEAKNELYYNTKRTATITVNDITLDEETVEFKVLCDSENIPALSEWTFKEENGNTCYVAYAEFSKDDIYEISFVCQDLAGNKSEEADGGRFVIDCTAPIVKIEFDNVTAKNDFYYKDDRTANIIVEDLSFDKDAFFITNKELEKGVFVETSVNWNSTKAKHTTQIECNKEGAYQFSVSATDLAGNEVVVVECDYFIIDKTMPLIEISGITDRSANQGEVAPKIKYTDLYIDDFNSTITLTGFMKKEIILNNTTVSEEFSKTVQYDDFPREKANDDIYTLTVHIEDKAGNSVEEVYLFSVNRFGSTFSLDDTTIAMLENYYTNAVTDIVITEVNVDELKQQQISVSVDGVPYVLRKDIDYRIEKQGSEESWKSYKYIIKGEYFTEGQYEVTIFTQDAANNQSDNNVQDLGIAFAVDKTAPSIVVSGIENNMGYEQKVIHMNMDIQDNMYLDNARVLINGQEMQSYSKEELETIVTYELAASNEPMDIEIVATDIVGNISKKEFHNIRVGHDVKSDMTKNLDNSALPIDDTKVPLEATSANNEDIKRMYIWGSVFIGTASILVLAAILLQRKKGKGEV